MERNSAAAIVAQPFASPNRFSAPLSVFVAHSGAELLLLAANILHWTRIYSTSIFAMLQFGQIKFARRTREHASLEE
ncbi:hypothetical protein KSC_053600 [Ktedonobacter sp. SOSP1-52]|nr:hypothetical protein KSC_053600 [Ktedonobacter sp. SOSP1-52]